VYGATKAAGEEAIEEIYPEGSIIIRTAWLYGQHGKHFPGTMLELSKTHDTLSVVTDQVGQPTWSRDLAQMIRTLIAGAGGAAHLPGMVASLTTLPVIGVPVALKYFDGMDSLLSIVQMPNGIPVATVAVGAAKNAALLAVRMLAAHDSALRDRLMIYQARLRDDVQAKTLDWF
jgi:phosphoribosylaminoimidazole carboxylase PurE protein